jgi:poly-gamma-glutamate synthesis protein (capsule biosynthesis protein)
LKVPAEWESVALEAIALLSSSDDQLSWKLDVGQPSIDDVEASRVDAVLIEGSQGILVAERPIALAVPFTSQWGELSLQQAEEILVGGSPFIEPMDWADMQPDMKSVSVEGYHPSDPEYPLQRRWSLITSNKAALSSRALAPLLNELIESDPTIKLTAVGDLMLARTIGEVLETGDLEYPFEHVAAQLHDSDLTIGNLESALGSGGVPEGKGYTFRAPPEAASALAQTGFDLLSLANNHAMDYGPALLVQAIATLNELGVQTIGAGEHDAAAHRPLLREVNGLQVSFLSFVDVPQEFRGFDTRNWQAQASRPGVAWADPSRMQLEIEFAQQDADLVVVLLHSGYEYIPEPSPPQVAAARAAMQAGADLVLGHHAHILQPIEFNPQGVIVYGLGNFVFEDAGPPESALLNVWLGADGVRELQFIPVQLDSQGRPFPASGAAAEKILASIYSYTDAWKVQTPRREP